MITVKVGSDTLRFPDDTPSDVVESNVKQHYSRTQVEENNFSDHLMRNVKGGITAAGDLIAGVPGMIAAAPYAAYEGITKGPEQGLQAMGEISNAMNPLREEFTYGKLPGIEALTPDRETGGYQNLMKPFEMMSEGYGNIASLPAQISGASPETVAKHGAAGELGFGVAMGGAMAAGPVAGRRAVARGEVAKADTAQKAQLMEEAVKAEYGVPDTNLTLEQSRLRARSLDEQLTAASKALDSKVSGASQKLDLRLLSEDERIFQGKSVQELQSIINHLNTRKSLLNATITDAEAYQKALDQIDNPIKGKKGKLESSGNPYGKDRPGPQYGGSRKGMSIPPDGSKAKGPRTDNLQAQAAFDADIRRLGEEYNVQRIKDEYSAKFVDAWKPDQILPPQEPAVRYDPETGYRVKERIKGPEAIAVEEPMAEGVARETRESMRRKPTSEVSKLDAPESELGKTRKIVRDSETSIGSEKLTSDPIGVNSKMEAIATSGGSVNAMLTEIATSSKVPFYKMLVSAWLKLHPKLNPRLTIESGKFLTQDLKQEGWKGAWTPGEYRVSFLKDHVKNEGLVVHEVGHAIGDNAITGVERGLPEFSHYKAPVKRLQELYNALLEHWILHPEEAKPYGLHNLREFFAEGWSKSKFQAYMGGLELPKSLQRPAQRTYWSAFAARVAALLGKEAERHAQTYLSEFIKAGADIIEGSTSKERRFYDQNPDAPSSGPVGGYSLEQFKSDLEAKGTKLAPEVIKAIYDKQQSKPTRSEPINPAQPVVAKIPGLTKLQRTFMETRPLEEMKSEIETTPDIGMVSGNVVGKIINSDYMAKDHPIIAWASSAINRIEGAKQVQLHDLFYGKDGTKKAPAPGSFYYEWSKISVKERVEVNDVGQALNNSQSKLSHESIQAKSREVNGRMLSQNQMKAYLDRLVINAQVLNLINTKLIEVGKEPIKALPHYWSPFEVDGRFLAIIKGKGENAGTVVRGSYLRPDEAKLKAVFKNHDIQIIERGSRSSFDFQQYELILRNLEKELRDPASRAIAEGYRRAGFGRHGMKREGAAGGLGTEGGRLGLDKYEETSEKYIRQSLEYVSARDIDKAYNELHDFAPAKTKPFAHAYALEALDQTRGGMNKAMESLSELVGKAFSGVGQVATLGKVVMPSSALRDVIKGGNQAKSALLLGFANLQFMAANMMQSSYAIPKLIGMSVEHGTIGNLMSVPVVMMKAANTLRQLNHPDIKALARLGTFDATMKYDWSSYASDRVKFENTLKDHLTGMSANAFIESHAVRKPAALMFLEMLRELGYEKVAKHPDEIYQLTKTLTEDYMVSFERHKKPAVFARTGLFGTITSPLQSFTTTWLAQLREYSQQSTKVARNPLNALPLASFLALNVATAGLVGVVGVKEWDLMAEALNKHFNMNIPTGTETIYKHFKSDTSRLGVLSDALGVHIGATFSAPTMTGTGAPGVGFGFDIGKAIFTGIKQTGLLGEMNKPTEAETRDALKGITPRSYGWGLIEKMYTPKDKPTQTAKGAGGPYTRTEKDWNARYLGMYTNEEVKGKATEYPVERQVANRSARLQKSAHLMVDSLLNGDRPEERIRELVKELAKDHYSSAEIKESLKNQLKSQVTEKDIRMMGKGTTTRQKLIIRMYNELR